MAIVTNVQPYFDDFNNDKNYVKILFNPGKDLQVRELNQVQSIIGDQIQKFAGAVFKNGSRIIGGSTLLMASPGFTIMEEESSIALREKVKQDYYIKNQNGIIAIIVAVETDYDNRLHVLYNTVGAEDTVEVPRLFNDDVIDVFADNDFTKAPTYTFIAKDKAWSHVFYLGEGVFYYDGYFVHCPWQYCVPYLKIRDGSFKIGLDIIEEVVTSDQEPSLLDNAIGFESEGAPGADRIRITARLSVRRMDPDDGDKFIALAEVSPYGVRQLKDFTEYSELGDYLAKRTFEESGNYTVQPFKIRLAEHDGNPEEVDANGIANKDKFLVELAPFLAYVKGYRVSFSQNSEYVIPKGSSTKYEENLHAQRYMVDVVRAKVGGINYISPNIPGSSDKATVTLLDATDEVVGTLKVNGVQYGGRNATEQDVNLFVTDIAVHPGKNIRQAVKMTSSDMPNWEATPKGTFFEVVPGQAASITDLTGSLPIKSLKNAGSGTGSIDATIYKTYNGTIAGNDLTFTDPFAEFQPFEALAAIDIGAGEFHTAVPVSFVISPDYHTVTYTFDSEFDAKAAIVTAKVKFINLPVKSKTYVPTKEVTITSLSPTDTIVLNTTDLIRVSSLTLVHKTNGNEVALSVSDFNVFDGQTDSAYVASSITPKYVGAWQRANLNNYNLRIIYAHFEHVDAPSSNGLGVFTSDSYAGNAYDNSLIYEDTKGQRYNLKSCVDFRTSEIGNLSAPYIVPNTDLTFDAEYYTPRIDILELDHTGKIHYTAGLPAPMPFPPAPSPDRMKICELHISPYTKSVNGIRVVVPDHKRFTMRDIGVLEKRIKNAEYYTALSLTEVSAETMAIKGQDGLDRFKNGFIVDNFKNYQAADLGDIEYRAGMDRVNAELRPRFNTYHRKLLLNEEKSSGFVKLKNGMITAKYVEYIWDQNPFATKSVSVNPYFIFTKSGQCRLSPSVDTWADVSTKPSINLQLDTGADAFASVVNTLDEFGPDVLQTEFGSWNAVGGTSLRSGAPPTFPVTVENITEQRTVTTDTVGTRTDSTGWTQITDMNIIPYSRSATIQFDIKGLRPDTLHHAFFDDENVDEFCQTLLNQKDLISDENGNLSGWFFLPSGRFFTGAKEFWVGTVTDIDYRYTDSNHSTAKGTYFSGGLSTTTQDVSVGTISPTLSSTVSAESRTVKNPAWVAEQARIAEAARQAAIAAAAARAAAAVPFAGGGDGGGDGGGGDPVAQSFTADADMYVTGLDFYLETIDKDNPNIWVSVRDTVNGYPSSVDLERKDLNLRELEAKTSRDASVPTNVTFDTPVYITKDQEFCVIIGGWSPETRVFVSRVGENLLGTDEQMPTQPSLGTFFKSQDARTWNAEQYEDLKYVLYTAGFESNEMKLVFENEDEAIPLTEKDPLECEELSDTYRLYFKDHGMREGDKFRINLFDEAEFVIKLDEWVVPDLNRWIYAQNGYGVLKSIVSQDQGAKTMTILVHKMKGLMRAGERFSFDVLPIVDIGGNVVRNPEPVRGLIINHPGDFVIGVPVEDFNKELSVKLVDSPDSILFDLGSTSRPSVSTRFGGDKVQILNANLKYDAFSVSGLVNLRGSVDSWTYDGFAHGSEAFPNDDYKQMLGKQVVLGSTHFLDQPYKLCSATNEDGLLKGTKSTTLTGKFTLPSNRMAPMVNPETMSSIFISNMVGWITEEGFANGPNSQIRFVPETHPMKGVEGYKYVTKTVTLKNPATDITIAFDVYKDVHADFDVFVKVMPDDDQRAMADVAWVKVDKIVKKNSMDAQDRVEYNFNLSDSVTGWTERPFNRLKLKLVGKAKNSSHPPIFRNMRMIATS